jgi:hypothetical protein
MNPLDAVGYVASGLVFAAFCMKDIIPLRLVAIFSNVAFLTYGLGMGLTPVWLLHAILLPINCWRLWQGCFTKLDGSSRFGSPFIAAILQKEPTLRQRAVART